LLVNLEDRAGHYPRTKTIPCAEETEMVPETCSLPTIRPWDQAGPPPNDSCLVCQDSGSSLPSCILLPIIPKVPLRSFDMTPCRGCLSKIIQSLMKNSS